VIFFPQWIREHGERTVCFQNEHLEQMHAYRDQGPTYPIYVVPEFAYITLCEHFGANDDSVIDTAPSQLPAGWADRAN
jgi:phenolic acid decarboxylase